MKKDNLGQVKKLGLVLKCLKRLLMMAWRKDWKQLGLILSSGKIKSPTPSNNSKYLSILSLLIFSNFWNLSNCTSPNAAFISHAFIC